MGKQYSYNIKMVNGLLVKDLSVKQVRDGLASGRFIPSDYISDEHTDWIPIRQTPFYKEKVKSSKGWMALFFVSLILNVIMMVTMFWQKYRIDELLK